MNTDFERAFVDYVVVQLKEKEMSHSEFARQLFPDQSEISAIRQWRRVRNPLNESSPRKISLSEAHRIGKILGTDLASIAWKVDQQLS